MSAETDAEEALHANEAFYAAFNAKDLDAMDAAWASREDIACIHPGWNVLRGRDRVLESWHAILTNPQQPRIVIGGSEATVVGEVAIVVCRELVAGSPLAATNVFVRQDGHWKVLHHQSGPVANLQS